MTVSRIVEPRLAKAGDLIPATKWATVDDDTIIGSMEIALRVLDARHPRRMAPDTISGLMKIVYIISGIVIKHR